MMKNAGGSSLSKPIGVFDDRRENLVPLRAGSGDAGDVRGRSRPPGEPCQFPQGGALPRRRQGELPMDPSERAGGDLRVQPPSDNLHEPNGLETYAPQRAASMFPF